MALSMSSVYFKKVKDFLANRCKLENMALNCLICPYDLPKGLTPSRGDYLASRAVRGNGSVYLILAAHLVKQRKWNALNRWKLECQREDPNVLMLNLGVKVWDLYWFPRDRKRQPKRIGKKLF